MSKPIKEHHVDCLNVLIDKLDGFSEEEIKNYICNLSIKEAEELGFRKWGENGLYLIPECFYDLLPVGIELTSIMGNKVVFDGSNIDTDTRFGLLAYGIFLKEEKNES